MIDRIGLTSLINDHLHAPHGQFVRPTGAVPITVTSDGAAWTRLEGRRSMYLCLDMDIER
jgi:hypothetical protein